MLSGLREVGPGRYVSARPVPVGGSWKSMLSLYRGDEVMAAPVYLPADPEIGAPEVPLLPQRRERMVRNTEVYLRESHAGSAWVGMAAYGGLALVVASWIALFAISSRPPTGAAAAATDRAEATRHGNGHVDAWSSAERRLLARRG